MVYLELTDARINLHINVSATQKAGLQISARVLKLATIFNP
jgi:YfiR/HmsC-like